MTKEVSYRCDICGLDLIPRTGIFIDGKALDLCVNHENSLRRWIYKERKAFEQSGV